MEPGASPTQPPARPALLRSRCAEGLGVAALAPQRRRASAPAGSLRADCKAHGARGWAPCSKAAAAAAAEEAPESDGEATLTTERCEPEVAAPPWSPPPRCDSEASPAAGSLWALALCPASGAVFAGGRAGALRWSVAASCTTPAAALASPAPPPHAMLRRGAEGAYALEAASDGAALFVGCGDGAVRALDSSSGALLATYGEADDDADSAAGVYALALAHAAGVLYAGAEDGAIRGWRVAGPGAGGCAESLDGHDSAVTALAAAPAGVDSATAVALISGCEGGALCGWRAGGDGAPAWRVEEAHAAGVTALAWSAHAGVVFSASWDGDVRATRAQDGTCVAHWPRALSSSGVAPSETSSDGASGCVAVTALALGPRGALWAGGGDGSVARLCARSGCVVASLPAAHGRRGVTALAASPCGERLFSAGLDRVARAWTVAPPAAWARTAHGRFPAPFRAAMAQLRAGCDDQRCALGRTLGALDADSRDGILEAIAAALASVAYPADETAMLTL